MEKRLLAGIAALLLLTGTLFALSACKPSVENIALDRNNMPQIVFVLGNDLDLSDGKLNADGEMIPLDSEDITVSGYDKNRLGEQTLTISYGGKTTTLTVTVVPRFRAAQKYVYFLGEEYADAQPRLSITRDDGTTINLTGDNEALTITGLDTDVPAETLTVNAVYEADGERYEGTFDVSVAEPSVNFVNPRKLVYGSHETRLDLAGASLRLRSTDGETTRNVNLSDLTAEGFDPGAVSESAPTATQTVTVSYRGRSVASFEITVNYSDVSRFKDAAKRLDELDWNCYRYPTEQDPGMAYPAGATDELTELSVEMLELYYGIGADRTYISQDELDAVARLAVVYSYNEWMNAVGSAFSDVFTIDETGELTYNCSTKEAAAAGAEKIRNADDADMQRIFRLAELLNNETLATRCEDTIIYDPMTQEDGSTVDVDLTAAVLASVVPEPSYMNRIAEVLEWSLEAFEALDETAVPADWTAEDLRAIPMETMDDVYQTLMEISERDTGSLSIFPLINGWRANEDYFEILYRYYYEDVKENASTSSILKIDNLAAVMLPLPLEALRVPFSYAQTAQQILQIYIDSYDPSSGELPLLTESTLFLYMYELALEGSENVLALNDEMYSELYARYFSEYLSEMTSGAGGYLALRGSSAYDDAVQAVWDAYFDIWLQYSEDASYVDTPEFDASVKAMFEAFVDLMPYQQYYFIRSVYYLYPNLPTSALYPDAGYLYSDFATFIYAYYLSAMNIDISSDEESTAYDVFTSLLLALEGYANGDNDYFCTQMQSAVSAYQTAVWTGTSKETFDSYLGFFYKKYAACFERFAMTDEGVWEYQEPSFDEQTQQTFAALADAIDGTSLAKVYIEDLSDIMGSVELYLPFLASYERVRDLSAQLAGGSEEVREAYFFMPYGEGSYLEPLYNGVYDADDAYARYLLTLEIDRAAYEQAEGLRTFLKEYADYFWTAAATMYQIGYMGTQFAFEPAAVAGMLSDFCALDKDAQFLLLSIDTLNLFHGGLEIMSRQQFKNTQVQTLVSDLLLLQISYVAYLQSPDGSYTGEDGETITFKEDVLSYWESASAGYAALEADAEEETATEFAAFLTYFGDLYEHYKTICTELAAQA